MRSTPSGGSGPSRFISDCCTMRCMKATGLPDSSIAPHPNVGDGPIIVVLNVVFSRPDDLHRFSGSLRSFHGIRDKIRLSAPAKTAAKVSRVDVDCLRR